MAAASSDEPNGSWQAHPWIARLIRGVVLGGPMCISIALALLSDRLLPPATHTGLVIARMSAIIGLSTGAIWGTDRLARRLLPLAVLLQLSLIFPDQAPSRLKTAVRGGSSRRLGRLVDEARTNGLDEDPGTAARQVVELIGALGDHDRRTRGHSERVRLYADMLGVELRLSVEERQKLQWGALLHDLGKLVVPPRILNKTGKPTADEWAVIEKHPEAGMKLIEPLRPFLGEWIDAIGSHHEKWDGTGYPKRLRGNEIPRAGAIVAVADSYEVMTAVRSYKKAMSARDARAELTRCAGTHFAPEVVRAFVSISIGRLRLVAGLLAGFAHVPVLGHAIQVPSTLAALPTSVGSAVLPTSAAVVALVAGTTVSSSQTNPTTSSGPVPVEVQAQAHGTPEPVDAGNSLPATSVVEGSTPANPDEGGDKEVDASTEPENETSTTTPPQDAPETSQPDADLRSQPSTDSPTISDPDLPAEETIPNGYESAQEPLSTTTTSVPAERLTLLVSGSSLRILPRSLDGSSFEPGEKIYVFARTNGWRVTYHYPGGSRTTGNDPYDMMGTVLAVLNAKAYVVPSTPGTYTISATVEGNGPSSTVVAGFTVE